MTDIEWPASELRAEVDRLRAALDAQRERAISALHVLNGGRTISDLQCERNDLAEEVKLLRAKLNEEQAENERLCAEVKMLRRGHAEFLEQNWSLLLSEAALKERITKLEAENRVLRGENISYEVYMLFTR